MTKKIDYDRKQTIHMLPTILLKLQATCRYRLSLEIWKISEVRLLGK